MEYLGTLGNPIAETTNGTEPKKRGRKPGAAKKIVARPSQSSLPIPTDEIVAAVNTLRSMPEDIMKCAIAIVTEIGKS